MLWNLWTDNLIRIELQLWRGRYSSVRPTFNDNSTTKQQVMSGRKTFSVFQVCESVLKKLACSLGLHSGAVVSSVASQQEGLGVKSSGWCLSLWHLHVVPVPGWVLSRCSGFLQWTKDMRARLIIHVRF